MCVSSRTKFPVLALVLELLTSPQVFTVGMIWAGFRVWKLTGFFILQYNVKMGRLLPSIRVSN